MVRSTVAVLLVALWAAPGQAQPPPPPPPSALGGAPSAALPSREGTGLIFGTVFDGSSGRPVAGAVVTLAGAGLSPATGGLRILTDSDGQFVCRGLPDGSLMLNVTKGGYLPGAYGRRTPGGPFRPLQLADGQRVGGVRIPIWRTAAITGTIVDEAGEPVVGIEVRAYRRTFLSGRRALRQEAQSQTDDRGAYRMFNLTPGQYVVGVASTTVAVPADVIAAYQAGISSNAPGRDALVRDLVSISAGGMPMMGPGSVQVSGLVMNARGRLTMPSSSDGRTFAYPTTFYPAAAASAQASIVTVGSGEERSSIDIQMKPAPAVSVSGVVTGPEGPASFVGVRLVPADAELMATELEMSNTMSDGAGAFRLINVTPGQYMLKVVKQPTAPRNPRDVTTTMVEVGGGTVFSTVTSSSPVDAPLPAGPTLWESMPISVGRSDLTDVAVALRTGTRLSGRVEFEGSAKIPEAAALQRITIMLEPAGGQMSRAAGQLRGRVESNAQFTTVGLPGGRYLLRVIGGLPAPWILKSAMHEGRDLADLPFDASGADLSGVTVTFTDTPSELSGMVTGGDGSPDPDAAVLVFPADTGAWAEWGTNPRRLRTERTSATGAFATRGLPAGDYYVVAVPPELAVDWQDPATLEALARDATPVRIEDGLKKAQALRTIRGR
jgi:hypothetical protein